MRIFISAGEPSGDLHGANLVQTFQRQWPGIECVGYGGDRMEDAGCRVLYPLASTAVMGIFQVFAHAPVFLKLISQADRYFRRHRPDALVLIDYPGFNWWMARRAHACGIPVFYFVPPQIWAWASWRVHKMRRFVDHVLCALPFEEHWYRERQVPATYIGHPYFDELAEHRPDAAFLAEQRSRPGPVIGLLPGSRGFEVHDNLPTLVRTAGLIRQRRPDARFLMACYKPHQRDYAANYLRQHDVPIETHTGRTPEIIQLSRACVAVSGSVGLELLYHRKPSVVVYRLGRFNWWMGKLLKNCPYISLVNLLAGRELYPEYWTTSCPAEPVSRHVLEWLNDAGAHADLQVRLTDLRRQVAVPGACDRAAAFMLEKLQGRMARRRSA